MSEIKGEYWIQNGHVEFADGDVGDYNHEAIAIQAFYSNFSDDIIELAKELKIKIDKSYLKYEDEIDTEFLQSMLHQIEEHLTDEMVPNPKQAIKAKLNLDPDAFSVMFGSSYASSYMMKKEGWIAVRGHNAELYGYDEQKRNSLLHGIEEILDNEGMPEGEDDEIDIYIDDSKTKKSYSFTLGELRNPISLKPQLPPTTKGDVRFTRPVDPTKTKAPKFNYDRSAQEKGIIAPGHNIWRGTSEWCTFREFIEKRERR